MTSRLEGRGIATLLLGAALVVGCEPSKEKTVEAIAPVTSSTAPAQSSPGGARSATPPKTPEGEALVDVMTPPKLPVRATKPAPPRTEADEVCQRDVKCRWRGHCHADGERCVAKYDSDCESSSYCIHDGRCTFDGKDDCVAKKASDCLALCWRQGRCQIKDDECHVGEESDCDIPCAREARCDARRNPIIRGMAYDGQVSGHASECVVPSNADCSKTAVCREKGLCELLVSRVNHGNPIEFECAEEGSPAWRFVPRGRGSAYHREMMKRRRERAKQEVNQGKNR